MAKHSIGGRISSETYEQGGEGVTSTKRTARIAGALYLVNGVTGFFSIIYVPNRLMVSGNAAATAGNILASERLFRLGIASEVICAVEFIYLLWVLYRLLNGASKTHASLMVIVLLLESGLRSGKEGLRPKWEDIDFVSGVIRIRQSKSIAGIRDVPISGRCKSALLSWNEHFGPKFSEYVFANPQKPEIHLVSVRSSWPNTLKAAEVPYFWLYDLRHTFATRLTAAGVSPVSVAQIIGHSNNLNILQTYARAITEYQKSAIAKLEALREAQPVQSSDSNGKPVSR